MLPRATQHGHGALELRILFVPGFWAWRLFRFSVFISILMGPLKDLGSPLKMVTEELVPACLSQCHF